MTIQDEKLLKPIAQRLDALGFRSNVIADILGIGYERTHLLLQKKHFTEAERAVAVARVDAGEARRAVAEELGVTPQCISYWRSRLRPK